MQDTAGEARMNSFVMYFYGPPHMPKQKQDDQHEHTYSSYVRIRDVTLKTCQKRWTIGRSSERGSGISVLAAQHDDDDDDFTMSNVPVIFLYITIIRAMYKCNVVSSELYLIFKINKTRKSFILDDTRFINLSHSRPMNLSDSYHYLIVSDRRCNNKTRAHNS